MGRGSRLYELSKNCNELEHAYKIRVNNKQKLYKLGLR